MHLDTERGWRGGERQVLLLAQASVRAGNRSIVVARIDQPLAKASSAAGLPVLSCAPASEFDFVDVLRLRRAIRAQKVEIVHAHTAHSVALGALATAGTRARMVVSRRVDFPLHRNVGSRWKYSRARAIIAVSNAVAKVLVTGGIAPSRIHVVPDGIDLSRRARPASRAVLAACGVPQGVRLAIQVAALVPHKDPLTFVRAIAAARRKVSALHALLVGEGPLQDAVRAAIVEMGLADVVHLTGFRTDADALLAAADVAVLSSREEGLGSVLLDAMALGRPIAATSAGGIPEVVRHEKTGLLAPPGNPHALGDAIAVLLTRPELAARYTAAAEVAVHDFSSERMASRTAEVYARVLEMP
jgi:glycosyltransferase involved in cell wall biosynthesis